MKKFYVSLLAILLIIGLLIGINLKKSRKANVQSNDKIVLGEVTHSVFYAPLYVAIENNYFKKQNIDVELILISGADKVSAAVLSNDVNIGFAGAESAIYVFNQKQNDYLQIFSGLTKRDGQFIVSKEKIDDFNLEYLYGKEILVGRKSGMPALNFLNALKKENIDPNKIDINYSVDFAALTGTFIGQSADFVNLFDLSATIRIIFSFTF